MKIASYVVVDSADSIDLDRGRESGILRWVIVLGLCAILIFAVLAFGAVEEWSTFAFETGAAVLFLIWAGRQVGSGQVKLSKNPLYLPALFFCLLLLAQVGLRTSAYGYITRYEVLQYVSYGIVLLIAAECVREEDARQKFAMVLIVFGVLYAFFALAQELTSNGKFFWVYTPRFNGSIYGSYVNHDHYAGLMEMLVPFPLVASMGHLLSGGKRVLVGFCAVLMASTIFLSGSRGGMLSLVLEIVVFATLTLVQRRNPRVALGVAAVCVLVLVFLVFLGKVQVLGRLGNLGPDMRLKITKDCLRMFSHRPVLGWGLGTFPTVYPGYRSFYTNLFVNEAHNDYAQLLVETGLIGFGLMLWFLTRLYKYGLPTSRRWEFKWDGAVSLAALLGCTGLLLHSFVDFNLQIPANAAMFYVLCGLAATRPLAKLSKRGRSRDAGDEGSGGRRIPVDNGDSLAQSI
ncbi:MAG TPA: O-antigen ligase family protein [Candidatus Sulfotelmatobacter sp.]|nr:O-antigen ligase family protein [Candidatus Sulfotelmatobacter sp.]